MKTFRNFNPVEFNSYVKFIKENVEHVLKNTNAKYVITRAAKDYNYNVEDVYEYLHEITLETYPEYMLKLNERDWRKVYENYMDDKELAPRLLEILTLKEWKKDNDFYRDRFFEVIKEMGINPGTMKIDMALDYFGWIRVWGTILKKADENPFTGEFAVNIKVEKETPKRETKSKSKKKLTKDKTKSSKKDGRKKSATPKEKVMNEKLEKSGKKSSGNLVAYYLNDYKEIDKTREIGRFSSQQEACDSLGINKGVLSNYLKGRKSSVFFHTEDGHKVRIGFEKLAA